MKRYKDLKEVLKHVWGVDTGTNGQSTESVIAPSYHKDSSRLSRSSVLDPLPPHLERFNPSLAELRATLGNDWSEVAGNPYILARYVNLIREAKMIAAGVVPPSFSDTGYCRNCGEVPLDFATKPLVGCPWCHSDEGPSLLN